MKAKIGWVRVSGSVKSGVPEPSVALNGASSGNGSSVSLNEAELRFEVF